MAPYFPLCLNLEGRHCVIIGGGQAATMKVRALLAFADNITVIAPECTPDIIKWDQEKKISLLKRGYIQGDLKTAFLAVIATDQEQTNQQALTEANEQGILVCMASNGAKGDFIFPAIVQRGSLVAGITASGKLPVLSAFAKNIVEEALPLEMAEWVEELEVLRQSLLLEGISRQERKTILQNRLKEFYKETLE